MVAIKANKYVLWFLKNWRVFSFGFALMMSSWQAYDFRTRYIETNELLQLTQARCQNAEGQVADMRQVYSDLLVNITSDKLDINDIRDPFWYKIYNPETHDYRMVEVNNAYQKLYGTSKTKYFGSVDSLMVVSSIAKAWRANDSIAHANPNEVFTFYERYVNKGGDIGIGKFKKWRIDKGNKIYIFGWQME